MLSQGRVKPNSASRLGASGPNSSAGGQGPGRVVIELNATPAPLTTAAGSRSSAPEPQSPVTETSLPAPVQRTSRSGSSLAVAHQEFSAATVSSSPGGGFPNRGPPVLANSSGMVASTRKGVAPMNAKPVPVGATTSSSPLPLTNSGSYHHNHQAHSADASNASVGPPTAAASSGPVLSNTARLQHQQQQQRVITEALSSGNLRQAGGGASTAPPSKTHHQLASASSYHDDKSSSANSSENSPTVPPASAVPFPKAPPLDLNSKASVLAGSPRQPLSASRGGRLSIDGSASVYNANGPSSTSQQMNSSTFSSGFGSDSSVDDVGSTSAPPTAGSAKVIVDSSHPAPSATASVDKVADAQHTSSRGPVARKRGSTSTPTPPPTGGTPTTGAEKTSAPSPSPTNRSHQASKSHKDHSGGGNASSPNKAPQIDIGPACQALSLYEAFTFDSVLKMWVVRDDVLAKCLEYIRIMGYQHPAYAAALQSVEKKLKAPSIWCSSAVIPSPIVPAPSTASGAAVPGMQQQTSGQSSNRGTPCIASPTVPAAPKLDDKAAPPVTGPQWKLVTPAKPPPTAAAASATGDSSSLVSCADDDAADKQSVRPLFFECEESLRWLAEQEYVIGTILLTCTFEPMSTTEKRAKLKKQQQAGNSPDADASLGEQHKLPSQASALQRRQYVPSHTHPIRYVAAHVIHNFSHWGDFKSFSAVWDAQVRIVLGVAASSHQKIIPVPETGLVFTSEFECGNLARVQRHVQGAYNNPFVQSGVCPPGSSTNVYLLWIEGDTQSDKRLWFRFAVSGCKEREPLCIRMMNIAPNARLYRNGMKPVWRAGASQIQWTPVDDYTFHLINDERDGELSFYIVPKSNHESIHVAFCVPYSYGDLLCHITQWHALVKRSACNIRFEERVLCRTLDERKLHLLIITSQTEKIGGKQQSQQLDSRGRPVQHPGATPYSSFASGKKVILVSGRVHPGEVTASHAVHGIVSFLLSHDPRAATLREHFIFFVVPMLNPDGVARGHSRLDQNGLNLNRCYNDPNPVTQPTVHSLRNVFDHLQTNFRDRFFMYLDFHSHASQQAGFAFGNHLPNSVQHWNMLFPKLIAIHSNELFDFDTCRFSRGHMVSKDGTSRVLFGGSLIHSYTIELTHFSDFKTFGDRLASSDSAAQSAPASNTATSATTAPVVGTPGPGKSKSSSSAAAASTIAPLAPTTTASSAVQLQSPVINGVISQSAEVGRACVLALLDYCSIGEYSADLLKFGGMDRAIREVKREIRGGGPQRPSSYSSQSVFKQY